MRIGYVDRQNTGADVYCVSSATIATKQSIFSCPYRVSTLAHGGYAAIQASSYGGLFGRNNWDARERLVTHVLH